MEENPSKSTFLFAGIFLPFKPMNFAGKLLDFLIFGFW